MRKIVLISIDDGTVWDAGLVELLNKYHIPATFNLNSGLADFVWYYQDYPIRRLDYRDTVELYRGHEVAGHSLTHPDLTTLSEEALIWEVGEDCRRLREAHGLEEIGFAVPFDFCRDREVEILRRRTDIRYIRQSEFRREFSLPADPWHIYVNGLYNDPDIGEKIWEFSRSELPVAVFVLCGHSYELEVNDHWGYMEQLLRFLKAFPGFEFMTTMEFVKEFYA